MDVRADWAKRAEYIRMPHAVEPAWADEAVSDEHAVWLTPDPASRSGHAVRVSGYSPSVGVVVTVILVSADADPVERPDGEWWGANVWLADWRDRRWYGEEEV